MEGDKLLILMSVTLLDRDSTFEIYQVINLPIPYPRANQKVGAVAWYRLETEYIALNLARNKFMMLPEGEANKCKTDALRTCTSTSPIYVTGNYNLCVLELFKGDKEGIRRYCRVEILADVVLPQAISISDGVWAVATQREIDLSMVCEEKTTQTIKVTMVELPLGCSAFGMSMSLPPYYQAEEKFEKKKAFSKLMENNLSNWAELWGPIVKRFPTVTLKKIPELLKPVEKIGFEQLKSKLDTVRETGTEWMTGTQLLMNWSAVIGTLIILAMITLVVRALMRRGKLKLRNKAVASALLNETGEPMGVLFEKNAEETVEIEPLVGSVTTTKTPIPAERKAVTKKRENK